MASKAKVPSRVNAFIQAGDSPEPKPPAENESPGVGMAALEGDAYPEWQEICGKLGEEADVIEGLILARRAALNQKAVAEEESKEYGKLIEAAMETMGEEKFGYQQYLVERVHSRSAAGIDQKLLFQFLVESGVDVDLVNAGFAVASTGGKAYSYVNIKKRTLPFATSSSVSTEGEGEGE